MPERPLRLAAVAYLNTTPLIQGLEVCRDVEVVRAVPSRIAAMVLGGEADLGLASVIDLARSGGRLVGLAGAGMIGCRGRTLTVRLFSRVPPERITVVHADTDSHTSTVLARVLLHRRWGVRAEVVDFDAREHAAEGAWPEAVLLIGDKVVASSPPAVRYEHQVDLGQAWHELTGLPFVYAVWVCTAERAGDAAVRGAVELLDRQRRRNAARLDWVVSETAGAKGWPGDLAREYVGRLLHYEVGPAEREAAGVFCAWAAELGLCEPGGPVWADAPACAAGA